MCCGVSGGESETWVGGSTPYIGATGRCGTAARACSRGNFVPCRGLARGGVADGGISRIDYTLTIRERIRIRIGIAILSIKVGGENADFNTKQEFKAVIWIISYVVNLENEQFMRLHQWSNKPK